MIKFVLAFALIASPGRGVHGAPAPIIGGAASLPVLAVGYGVYWLVKRRRKVK